MSVFRYNGSQNLIVSYLLRYSSSGSISLIYGVLPMPINILFLDWWKLVFQNLITVKFSLRICQRASSLVCFAGLADIAGSTSWTC